ncbi:MAG: hypothetical protein GXC72_00035 [Chitinophagaceae bacterium]|nr:hypothetical protein [Chitinophagaceae bacterium]
MKLILAILFGACSLTASSQIMQLYDPQANRVFNAEKYSGIRGTPFLVDKWYKGTVTTPKGIYMNLELKLNVYDNQLFFNKDDQSFEFTDPIVSFTLMPKPGDSASYQVFKKGINGSGVKADQFVQELVAGKLGLYKSDFKSLSEMSEINAGIVKTFATTTRYYLVRDNNAQLIKISKADVMPLLKDKEEQVNTFITEKKLAFKKEADLIALIQFYNQL